MPDTPVGTDSPDYALTSADLGATVYCKVTATNASGTANADSNTVGPVTAATSGIYAYLADAEIVNAGDDVPITCSPINTTGAGLLLVVAAVYTTTSPATLTDSKGNTWTLEPNSPEGNLQVFYCVPTTTGTGHTVTFDAPAVTAGGFCFIAFSGGTSSPFEDAVGEMSGTTSPCAPGSITPLTNNSLVISAIVNFGVPSGGSATVSGGFTKVCDLPRDGSNLGLTVGYLIQTTAAAANPSWTITGIDIWIGRNFVFKSS